MFYIYSKQRKAYWTGEKWSDIIGDAFMCNFIGTQVYDLPGGGEWVQL